jgi:3-phenylpropionate/cinnamic acid dioxygenase small subunit
MGLSIEDRAELHDIYARYAYAFDGGDGDAWSALFAAQGRFSPPNAPVVVGTEALRAFVAARASDAPGMRHLMSNVLVEATETGARGSSYFLCFRLDGDVFRLRNFGRYDDEFIREDGAWKIANRNIVAELAQGLVDAPFAFA